MRIWSWTNLEAVALRARIGQCLPRHAFVAAWGPDAAILAETENARPVEVQASGPEPTFGLEDVPGTWAAGRAFGGQWEVLWRHDGGRGSVVVAGNDVPARLLEAAEPCPPLGEPEWQRITGSRPDGQGRPERLLLFRPGDQRLPRRPAYHVRLGAETPLHVEIEEWGDDDGLRWIRYVGLASGRAGGRG